MLHITNLSDSDAPSSRKSFTILITFIAHFLTKFLASPIYSFLVSPICRLPTNLILILISCHELRWFNRNIYAHCPFVESIPSNYVDTGINWVIGFVAVSFFVAIRRGPLPFFRNPRNYFGDDTYTILSSKYATIILVIFIPVVFLLIQHFPAVHIDYDIDGDKPIVKVDGALLNFVGSSIALRIDPNILKSTVIDVSDRRDFYSIRVKLLEASRPDPWFGNHRRLNLDEVFAHLSITATLTDSQPQGKLIHSFSIDYEKDGSVEKQCSDSDSDDYFANGECGRFFRKLFDAMGTTSTGMMRDSSGSFEFSGSLYEYKYQYSEQKHARISITTLPRYTFRSNSLIIKKAPNAFQTYKSRNDVERRELARKFAEGIKSLSVDLKDELFRDLLHDIDDVSDALSGNPSQRNTALSFVNDIIVPGSIHLSSEQKNQIYSRISKSGYIALANITNVNDINSDTVALMIEVQLSLRRDLQTLAVVRKTLTAMKTIGNVTPRVVDAIFTPLVRDGVNRQEAVSVANIINSLRMPDPRDTRAAREREAEVQHEIESVISKHWSRLPTEWIEPHLNKR